MARKPFRILLLSDAHIGHPTHLIDALSVMKPLLADIQTMSAQIGVPDLIVFSGDLAYGTIPNSTIESQYVQAEEFIENVYVASGAKRDEVPLALAPGNHDIDRTKIDAGQTAWFNSLTGADAEECVRREMMGSTKFWGRLLERQAAWLDFAKRVCRHTKWDEDWPWGVIDLTHDQTRVAVAILNTSWAAEREIERHRLWLGRFQMQRVLNLLDGASFKIAVTHHPPSWLHPSEEFWIRQRLESSFNLYLHGHEHQSWVLGDGRNLTVEAGATYEGSNRTNGYAWIDCDLANGEHVVRMREYSDAGSGGWRAMAIPGKTDKDGAYFAAAATTLAQPVIASQPSQTGPPSTSVNFPPDTADAVAAFASLLQDSFGFRWEPSTFRDRDQAFVYWPVTLRYPTPIHAVQTFAAAGLSRKGAKVQLWIDDLGNVEFTADRFKKSITRWFDHAGGVGTLDVTVFSAILSDNASHGWDIVRKWLGFTPYRLEQVLRVSKVLPSEPTDPETTAKIISSERPRRLLTPAAVWTCLMHLHSAQPNQPIITLGGYDEQSLWHAWKVCIDVQDAEVGHCYAPELRATKGVESERIHMARKNLAWASKEDIEAAIAESLSSVPLTETTQNDLVGWLFVGLVLLPEYLLTGTVGVNIGDQLVTSVQEVRSLRHEDFIPVLVSYVVKWVLG